MNKYYPYPAHDNKPKYYIITNSGHKVYFGLRVIATSQFTKTQQGNKDM